MSSRARFGRQTRQALIHLASRNPMDNYMSQQRMQDVKAEAMPELTESNDEENEATLAAQMAAVDIGRISPTRATGEG